MTGMRDRDPDYDVVIIGAGLAGLTVALNLAETQPVIVLAKRQLQEAATAWAQGGIVGVLGSDDSIASHVRDTQEAGAGLVDQHTAEFIAQHSAAAVEWLVERGVPFSPDPEGPLGLHLTREGGHAVRRIAHAADATGKAIHDVLLDEARQHPAGADLEERAHPGRGQRAHLFDERDRFRQLVREQILGGARVVRVRGRGGVREHRHRARMRHRVGGGHEGVADRDDLVCLSGIPSLQAPERSFHRFEQLEPLLQR